jgi:hypothetical protein
MAGNNVNASNKEGLAARQEGLMDLENGNT